MVRHPAIAYDFLFNCRWYLSNERMHLQLD